MTRQLTSLGRNLDTELLYIQVRSHSQGHIAGRSSQLPLIRKVAQGEWISRLKALSRGRKLSQSFNLEVAYRGNESSILL